MHPAHPAIAIEIAPKSAPTSLVERIFRSRDKFNSLFSILIYIPTAKMTLTIAQLQNLLLSALPTPILEPTSAQAQHHKCPICLSFKPTKLALHQECYRSICIECALDLIDQETSPCPHCKGSEKGAATSQTSMIKLLPADHFILDNIDYNCDACGVKFHIAEARRHPSSCDRIRRQPAHPHHQPSRPLQALVRHEVVSNPALNRERGLDNEPLLVMRLDGNRLPVRQFPRHKTIGFIRNKLAKVAKVSPSELKIFHFTHRELNDRDLLDRLAPTKGSVQLAATTSSTNLGNETANLILESPGEPPLPPRRPAEDFDHNQFMAQMAEFQAEQEAHPFINPWLD